MAKNKEIVSVSEGTRLKAFFIDIVLVYILIIALSVFIGVLVGIVGLNGEEVSTSFVTFLVVLYLIYILIKDSYNISIASRMLKLKVIDYKTHKSCNILQSIARNLFLIIPVLKLLSDLLTIIDLY